MTPKGEAKKKQIPQPRSHRNRGTGFGMTPKNITYKTTHPALMRWAKVCRASGAGRNANSPSSSRHLRTGPAYSRQVNLYRASGA
jgi:hypothetical protein